MPYNPTTWNEGAAPGISAAELNRIEDGIDDVHKGVAQLEVEGVVEVAGPILLNETSVPGDILATVDLAIPAVWNTHSIFAVATMSLTIASQVVDGGTGRALIMIQIEGVNHQEQATRIAPFEHNPGFWTRPEISASVVAHDSGLSGNGLVRLYGRRPGSVNTLDGKEFALYAKARRTS